MSNPEQYKFEGTGLSSPAYDGEAVTPSDVTDLSESSRAIYVGGAGNISVEMLGGTTLTFSSVAAGSLLPLRITRVNSTGTTATNILALR